jgi:hypothetical protein
LVAQNIKTAVEPEVTLELLCRYFKAPCLAEPFCRLTSQAPKRANGWSGDFHGNQSLVFRQLWPQQNYSSLETDEVLLWRGQRQKHQNTVQKLSTRSAKKYARMRKDYKMSSIWSPEEKGL